MKRIVLFVILGMLVMIAAGCGDGGSDPSTVIESYLTSLIEGDNAKSVSLSCAAWEETAGAEGASFEGVEARLEGMACSTVSEDGSTAVVACEGDIVFSYAGGEDEVRPLNLRNYALAFEGGEWRMCGYE